MSWIKIKDEENKPPVDQPVLIFADKEIGIAMLGRNGKWQECLNWAICSGEWGSYSDDREIEKEKISHWMYLPDEPVS